MEKNNKKNNSGEEVVDTQIIPKAEVAVKEVKTEFDIDGFLEMRTEFISKVNKIMVQGSDYHEIQGKKSLAKGGAEKIASIFGWTATFTKDTETLEAFSDIKGIVAYVCNLEKDNRVIGQGRGAAVLIKNASDPNKTIKMAQKSAFIDAVLRASGLSDFFTQDLEDHPEHLQPAQNYQQPYQKPYQQAPGKYRASTKQMDFIGKLCKEKNVSKEDLKEVIKVHNFTNASDIITYLLGMPIQEKQEPQELPQELPVIQEEDIDVSKIPF